MPNFALCTSADLPLLHDFSILVRTFRKVHPDVPILCVGQSNFKAECDRVGVIHVAYDKEWDFYRGVVHLKALAITEALKVAPSALFCDCDVFFLSQYESRPGTWISPHYMKAGACANWGTYNCGYVATDDPSLAPWWVKHVLEHPKEFGEQQALEHFSEAFTVNEFDAGHNVGWWRLVHGDDPAAFAAGLKVVDGALHCGSRRVVSVHTHLFRYGNAKSVQSLDGIVSSFNNLLRRRLGAEQFVKLIEG